MIQKALEWIQASLVSSEDIIFLGFGSFVVQKTSAREGRNPRSGEVIQIPEGKRVVFRSGKLLKDALKGQNTSTKKETKTLNVIDRKESCL